MKSGEGTICYRRWPKLVGGKREVRITAKNVDTQEMRATILALWSMLPWDHRLDMIKELKHYVAPKAHTYLPDVALAACQAQHGHTDLDLCPKRPDQVVELVQNDTQS